MDASFSEAFLVDNDELDLIGSDVEGSSGYGSESDGYASLSDFPMVSTDDLTRPTRECDVMKVFYQLILKHLREQTTNKKSKTSITSTTNLVIPVVKYDVDVFRSLIEFVHCGTAKIEMKTVADISTLQHGRRQETQVRTEERNYCVTPSFSKDNKLDV
ncbi:hypothetical protein ScPMuIL_015620 [Solemya velum]